MTRRHLLGLPRCIALVALGAAGLVVAFLSGLAAALLAVGLLPVYIGAMAQVRRMAELGRRLATRWGGHPVTASYSPLPPPPRPRPDGWYTFGDQVYRSRRLVVWLGHYAWLRTDKVIGRDWFWLLLTPVTGGLAAAFPLAVLAGAVGAVLRWPLELGVPVAAVLVVVAVALAPVMVTLHGRWTGEMLGPAERSRWHTSGIGPAVARARRATWRGAGLAVFSLACFECGLLQVGTAVVSAGRLLPWAVVACRPVLAAYRSRARTWTGEAYATPYLPVAEPAEPEADGRYRVGRVLIADRAAALAARQRAMATSDPATWRDLLWMITSPWLVLPAVLPLVLVVLGFFGLVWAPLWSAPWAALAGASPFYLWDQLPLDPLPGILSPVAGLAVTVVGLLLAPPLFALRRWWDRLLLSPTRSATLAQRVRQLTESRAEALDTQAAELRRIERDLHDGAQARLVSVGLNLATAEHLLDSDPQAARSLIAKARESSATALTELRNLVRGIHPPVLAERGLADAVRAVALDCPIPVRVSVELPGRFAAPVESAAYFATCEALANAGRHGGAGAISVDIGFAEERLTIVVRDDGHGGADPSRGTGLRGITRRLGSFDGHVHLHSPPGGPTVVTMEIPCALSSPRTSTC
jgi:signal transduction histidine kinase